MKSNLLKTGLKFSAALIPVIVCFVYFRYIVPYHVCFKEQIQMFIFSSSFILSYFSKSAFLACMGGDFLTQFLYFKWSGALTVTLLLAIEWLLIFLILKRFIVETRHNASLLAISLIPVVIEWIFLSSVFYYLSYSVSVIIFLIIFLIYAKTNGKVSVFAGILLIPALYVLAGASVFLFLFLVILYDIHYRRKRFIYWIVIAGLAFAAPVLLRHTYLLSFKQAYFYPYPDIKQLNLITFALVVFAIVVGSGIFNSFKRRRASSLKKRNIPQWLSPLAAWLVVGVLLVAGLIKTTDKKQENLYAITIEAYHRNWNKVLEIAERTKLQNTIATNYTNLALSYKNLLGERLMDFYQPSLSGLLLPSDASFSSWFALMMANDAYYHIGDMDMAQHSALIGMLSMPQKRSARLVKRMAEINMAKGDIPAATKYIRILESTLFYKPASISNSLQPRAGIFKKDVIRKSTDIKLSLELLAESDPENRPALNYLLCYYLLSKDIPSFFNAYTSYYKGKYRPVPKVYAEALLIHFARMKSSIEEVYEYEIRQDIIQKFGEYNKLNETSGRNRNALQKKFNNTYWFYFQFLNN